MSSQVKANAAGPETNFENHRSQAPKTLLWMVRSTGKTRSEHHKETLLKTQEENSQTTTEKKTKQTNKTEQDPTLWYGLHCMDLRFESPRGLAC